MMKPLASFLILLLCSTVHSKSSSRADKISQRSRVLPKTAVIRENEGTATVVKLLRARKTYFEGAFFLSHIVALIKCITTIDILYKDPSLPLNSAIKSAVGSSIGDLSILPAASPQSFYSFFQVILSLSCHIGYSYMLRQFPSVREFICFAETNNLRDATAALVLEEEAGWGDAVSDSRRVIVPLESSEMQSVTQCLSRLQVSASSTPTQYKQNHELFSREFADRGRNTNTTEAREVEVNDIKLFLFQRSRQKPTVKVSKKSTCKDKLKKVKRRRKKSSEGGLTVVAGVPNCNMHLKELKEMVSQMDKYDKQVRDQENTNTEDITSDAVAFGLTAETATERLKLYGGNRITVRPPSVRERLASRFLSSAYIMTSFFQFLSILEEPIQTPLRRIAMSVFMDAGDILRDSRSAKKLEREVSSTNAQHTSSSSSSSSSSARECTVIRDSKEVQVKIEEVVPGDILCLSEGPVPADCLLLEGSCVVNEAFLTGEAVPQPRESIDYSHIDDSLESVTEGGSCGDKNKEGGSIEEEEDAEEGGASGYLCLLKHQRSILYGGSEILQYTCSEPLYSRQPLRCLVLKTGFSSVQGVLVRKMKALGGELNAPGAGSGLLSPALQRDASKLLAWLSVSAVGFSLHVYRQGRLQGISRYQLLVQVCRIIASVATPDIDKDITFTIRKSARRLTRMEGVYCTDPSKLAVAGLVTACLFDKTGTIATDIVVAGDAVTLCQGALPAGDTNTEHNALTAHVDPLLYSPSTLSNLNDDKDNIKAEWRKQEWPLSASPLGLQIVIATCHSAMELQSRDGTRLQRYIGDPLECALLDRLTRPPDLRPATASKTKAADNVEIEQSTDTGIGAGTGLGIGLGLGQVRGSWKIDVNSKSAVWVPEALDPSTERSEVCVKVRSIVSFPFDVKLQRMSVVATLSRPSGCHNTASAPHTGLGGVLGLAGGEGEGGLGEEGGVDHYVSGNNKQQRGQASPHDTITEHFISTKGSPESVFACLSYQQRQDKIFRARYFAEFERLARQGKRVIAFASKSVPVQSTISSMSRQDAEENLHFQGFVSFACPIRSDSRAAITALTDAKLKVAMLTGDSLLTALHTARECLIIGGRSSADESSLESSSNSKVRDGERDGDRGEDGDRDRDRDRDKGCSSDVIESKVLVLSVSKRDGDKDRISIAPKGQEVHALPAMKRLVWKDEEGHEVYKYCSEAKKNHSGRKFRDVSTDSSSSDSEYLDDKNDDDIDDEDVDDSSELVGLSARELSSLGGFDLVTSGDAIALLCTGGPSFPKGDMGELRYFKVFARADPETKSSVVKAFKSAGEVVLMCGDGANDVLALKTADVGVALLTGFNLLNADSSGFSGPQNGTATSAEHAKAGHRKGLVEEKKGDEDEDDESDVKIGDASAAAPFTARRPSIYSVVGLIRHGRAAHVMVLHSFQVACIEAMLRGTALSLLFLHSIRYTPEQSLVLEVILLVVNFGLLQVPPVDALSESAPPPSILSPHMLQRLVIQIVHHVASVIFGLRVGLALDARCSASAPALPSPNPPTAGGALKPVTADSRLKVHGPQARNTVMFLLSVMQAASIPLGAYMGRPFLPDTQEMPKLRHTIVLVVAASIMAALQLIPGLNTSLDLFVLTRVIDRVKVLLVVGLSFIIVTCGVAHHIS